MLEQLEALEAIVRTDLTADCTPHRPTAKHGTPVLYSTSSVVSSVGCSLISVLCPLPSVLCPPLSSVLGPLSFVFCPLFFVVWQCPLFFVLCPLGYFCTSVVEVVHLIWVGCELHFHKLCWSSLVKRV